MTSCGWQAALLRADVMGNIRGIGIDAERLKRFERLQTTRAGASLVRAAYTEAEQAAIGLDAELLTLAWTAKEATAKALGYGLIGSNTGCAVCREIDVSAILCQRGPRAGRVMLFGPTAARAVAADVHAVVASARVLEGFAVSMAVALRDFGGEDTVLRVQRLTDEAMGNGTARQRRRQDRP